MVTETASSFLASDKLKLDSFEDRLEQTKNDLLDIFKLDSHQEDVKKAGIPDFVTFTTNTPGLGNLDSL